MIYYDKYKLPVNEHQDGGDSCVRAGLLAMMNPSEVNRDLLYKYEAAPGMFVRHPIQVPWNNKFNFTRDQMMCLLAGIKATGAHDLARRMFWSRLKAFCFSQSSERDVVGSKKWLWPHSNWKDSVPTPHTFKYKTINDVVINGEVKFTAEHKIADWADPLFPNHMGTIIIAGKMWYLYPLLVIAYPVHLLFLWLHSKSKHYEENQMISECSIFGTKEILKKLKPHWIENSRKYWQDRNEIEYHNMLVEFMK
jgi:hypothetical protein